MNTDRFKLRVAIRQEDGSYKLFPVTCICYQPNGDITVDYKDPALPYGGDVKIDGENAILEQCTGLTDKNGKLIFEGDVVRYYRSTAMGLGGERIASVLWDERDAEFGILTTLGDGYNMWEALRFGIKIIGNIHEMEQEQ